MQTGNMQASEMTLEDWRERAEEYERVFNLQWTRMHEATRLWRSENPGNDHILPDLGALLEWLMKRGDR